MIKSVIYTAVMALVLLLVVCMVPVIILEKILAAVVCRLMAVSSLVLSGVNHE